MVRRAIQICMFPALMAVLLCAKGGYDGEATCACGLVILLAGAVFSLTERRGLCSLGVVPLLFGALALAFFVGALVNGKTLTTIGEAGTWAGVFGASLFASLQCATVRQRSLDLLCWVGVAFALVGLILFTGVVSWYGAVDAERLHFPTTYANSAGVWFAVTAFLCMLSQNAMLRSLAPIPLAALMLTRSSGALVVFVLVATVIVVFWWHSGKQFRIMALIVRTFVAAGIFACAFYLPALPATACTIISVVLLIPSCRVISSRLTNIHFAGRIAQSVMIVSFALAAVALTVPIMQRSGEAAAHLRMRADYLHDAFHLLGSSPILGVGPDNWQFLYQHVQTASYRTTVVHCSYMQVALDAGLIGLMLLVTGSIIGVSNLVKAHDMRSLAPIALMLVHSLVDFDLQFGALAFLFAYLLSAQPANYPEKSIDGALVPSKGAALVGFSATCLVLVLAVIGCMVGCSSAHVKNQMKRVSADEAVSLVESTELASNDPEARAHYLEALRSLGKSDIAARDVVMRGVWYDRQAIIGAEVLYDVDERALGASLMIDELEKSPYDEGLFRAASDLFNNRGIPADVARRYNDAVERAEKTRAAPS